MKRTLAAAAGAAAAVVLSACGASRPIAAPAAAHYHGADSLTFVANAPSTGLGVENTDLYAATPNGKVRAVTSTPAAETDAAWSADGRHVVFIRHWTTARTGGRIVVHSGVFAWSPGHGDPREIAACGQYCEQQDFAWSPDDSRIAFTVNSPNAIGVMDADGSHVHLICDNACGGVEGPVWSPDGRRLAFSNAPYGFGPFDPPGAIWVANADGSGVRKLTQPACDFSQPRKRLGCAIDASPAWSSSGSLIAFSRRPVRFLPQGGERIGHTEIEVMRADGSHLRTLATCRGAFCLQDLQPIWSPTGAAITWVRVSKSKSVIQLTNLAGRTSALRTCAGSRCVNPGSPTWSPDGKQLAFLAGGGAAYEIWTIQSDGTGLRRIADGADPCCLAWIGRTALPGRPPQRTRGGHTPPHLSGTVAFDTDEGQSAPELRLLSLATGRVTGLAVEPSMVVQPSWSPDGRQIAFAGQRGNENTNIYVADRNGSHLRELTHFGHGATQPAWSPDGKLIAFETDAGIELVRVSDDHIRALVAKGSDPSWAPGGSELVFDRPLGRGESEALFTIRPDGTGLKRLTHLPRLQRYPAWSPDGREIAFDWLTSGGESLYLIRPDGTHLRRATPAVIPDGRPAWSPDGRYLLLLPNTNGGSAVEVVSVKTGRVTTLEAIPAYAADPSWTAR